MLILMRCLLVAVAGLLLAACSEDVRYKPVHRYVFDNDVSVSVLAGKPYPLWFGSHPVMVLATVGERQYVIHERLYNDGVILSKYNFPVAKYDEWLVVCFHGQEQADLRYGIPLNDVMAVPEAAEGECPDVPESVSEEAPYE